jgi:alanine dehydrogenase
VADLGIRREEKNRWERRVPLTPLHVEELIREQGRTVVVQPSPLRIFPDAEYRRAGAELSENLSGCRAILGIKEVPPDRLQAEKPTLAFFHVIKGQPLGMPLLAKALELRSTLIDYERIVDRYGRRLLFFGRHAGYAGMIDALWALGRRLAARGLETPFAAVGRAHSYPGVDEAEEFLTAGVARQIREEGLPETLRPLVVGFTGGGNVSQGAQEILDRLPVVEIHPDDLPDLAQKPGLSHRTLYKVVFRRKHRVRFARHLPYLTVLVNGIYWEPGHPKLITREDLQRLWSGSGPPRLEVVADVSCDVPGPIEATVRATDPDRPVYVFDPSTGATRDGVEGRGPVVLAVENLPAEFPRDASEHFGDSLFPFLDGLLSADFDLPFEHLALPAAILGATLTHQGELTPRYRDLRTAMEAVGALPPSAGGSP